MRGFKIDGSKPSGSGTSWDELDLRTLEAEVFLLGHWNNFDELESNLSIDELNAVLEASRGKEEREMKFMAAMNGVDLEESNKEPEDVTTLQNPNLAAKEGFGVGEGLGFMEL